MDGNFLDSWCGEIMRRAGISRSPKNRSDSFSGGMLQRVLLARELEENASLLILAEPGWGLDQDGRARMADELRAYARSGKSVLLFSTDVDELLSIADEIVVLFNGALSPAGTRAEIGRAMVGSYDREARHEL
jgi:simple sugar transport system ATP-binding protein